jgi:NADP-dependent 3-hydroxy acid dehydrogenase YdfG
MSKTAVKTPSDRKAFTITDPTSGIGRVTALELAKHGTVVLVGRDRVKLDEMMQGSSLVRDPNFQDRVVAETRTLLAKIPTFAAAR